MANNTLIEGLDNNQKTGLNSVIIPAADALETVSVSTCNFDAEFGRPAARSRTSTLKSGTNSFKGSGFFFGNNESTNASDYFTHRKAPTTFAQGGFTLGGPIVRDKLFFFGDYQRTVDNLGYVVRATIPHARDGATATSRRRQRHLRSADGSGEWQRPHGVPEQPDSAGTGISPIARQLLAQIPEPNLPARRSARTTIRRRRFARRRPTPSTRR